MVGIVSAAIAGIGSIGIGGGLALAGGLGAAGSLAGSFLQSNAENRAINEQQSMFNTAYGAQAPFIQAGQSVLPTLTSLLTPGANQTETLNQIPGFQFTQDWGQKAVQNLGTTTGLGGNVLTAGANYATGVAQQGWSNIVNQLQSLVNTGAGTAGNVGGQAVQAGGNIASNMVGQGTAQAAGAVGATSSIGNALTTSALLQALKGGGGMYTTPQYAAGGMT